VVLVEASPKRTNQDGEFEELRVKKSWGNRRARRDETRLIYKNSTFKDGNKTKVDRLLVYIGCYAYRIILDALLNTYKVAR
jgi:hypothetical protein